MFSDQFLPKNSFWSHRLFFCIFSASFNGCKTPHYGKCSGTPLCPTWACVGYFSAYRCSYVLTSVTFHPHGKVDPQKLHNQIVVKAQSSRKLENTQFRQILEMYQCVTIFLHESFWNSMSVSRNRHARKPLGPYVVSYPPTPVARCDQKQAFLRALQISAFCDSKKLAVNEQKKSRRHGKWILRGKLNGKHMLDAWNGQTRIERSPQSCVIIMPRCVKPRDSQLWELRSVREFVHFRHQAYDSRSVFGVELIFRIACSFSAHFQLVFVVIKRWYLQTRRNACFWCRLLTGVGGYDTTCSSSGFLACLLLESDLLFQELSCRKRVTHWYITKIWRNCVLFNFRELWSLTTLWLWSFCGVHLSMWVKYHADKPIRASIRAEVTNTRSDWIQ